MPTKYINFTDEQKQRARQTDLCEFLRLRGEPLKRSGSEYEWLDGSQKVTIRGNLWFHQYDREGGDTNRPSDKVLHIQIALGAPFARSPVTEPGANEHQRGLSVGESSDHLCSAFDLAVQSPQGVARVLIQCCDGNDINVSVSSNPASMVFASFFAL